MRVVSDPTQRPCWCHQEVEDADAAVTGGVPGQRQAVDRVEGRDAGPVDRTLAGLVGGERVVLPAGVAAGVDDGVGDLDRVRRVAAGVVDPRRLRPPRRSRRCRTGRCCRRPCPAPPYAPVVDDHEEAAVGGEVEVAHVAVERRRAGGLVERGLPVRPSPTAVAPLRSSISSWWCFERVDGVEVAERDQPGALGVDVDLHARWWCRRCAGRR